MAKDTVTVSIGIIYTVLTIIQFVTLFLPYEYGIWNSVLSNYEYYTSIFLFSSSIWVFLIFGAAFLIPSFILNVVFIASTQGTKGGKVGFGMGVAAWVYFVLGYIQLYSTPNYLSVTTYVLMLSIILTTCLIIFGILLFTRAFKIQSRMNQELLSSLSTPSPEPTSHLRASSADFLVGPPCPDCNKATKFIAQYNQYYCPDCQKYLQA